MTDSRILRSIHASTDTIAGMTRRWDFVPTPVQRWRIRQAVETVLRNSQPRPAWKAIVPLNAQPAWTVYFLFSPDGVFTPTHRFALERLRDAGHRLMIVCAAPSAAAIPAEVAAFADALYWKALSGYDFSAYSAALREISHKSPHADVLVINDSVYGPFTDVRSVLAHAPWELTGFTATSQVENHIQSYAFVLKDVTPARMRSLATVMFPWRALSHPHDVIQVQETRFARVAARSLRVGAYWFAEKEQVLDPTLFRPIELIAAGFPFLKRSLTGKHQTLQDVEQIRELLFSLGHPVPART
jgi:lipopolysaccharide biosynthesis protein